MNSEKGFMLELREEEKEGEGQEVHGGRDWLKNVLSMERRGEKGGEDNILYFWEYGEREKEEKRKEDSTVHLMSKSIG